MLDLLSNVPTAYEDFAFKVNGVEYTMTISHTYLTLNGFIARFNAN
jgi:hypothetical protein